MLPAGTCGGVPNSPGDAPDVPLGGVNTVRPTIGTRVEEEEEEEGGGAVKGEEAAAAAAARVARRRRSSSRCRRIRVSRDVRGGDEVEVWGSDGETLVEDVVGIAGDTASAGDADDAANAGDAAAEVVGVVVVDEDDAAEEEDGTEDAGLSALAAERADWMVD
jgi:hypothetical protein